MSIKYDGSYVKKPLDIIEYTPEMVLELKKCSEDIQHFLKYVRIVHPDKGRIQFDPYPFQRQILETVKDNRFTIILCARQAGKCLSGDTEITIKNKKTGKIEKINMENLYTSKEK